MSTRTATVRSDRGRTTGDPASERRRRVDALLSRATSLFSDHLDDAGWLAPGTYRERWAGRLVLLTLAPYGTVRVSIVQAEEACHDLDGFDPLFDATWQPGGPAMVLEWRQGGTWERAFVASHA